MHCPKKYYIRLSDSKRVLIYHFDSNGTPIFTEQSLWSLLSFIGKYTLRPGGVVRQFPLPSVSSSKIVGTPYLMDPTSVVRALSFTNENPDGPITAVDVNTPFILNTYNESVDFKVSWRIRSCNQDVRIGFYSSAVFEFGVTNNLYLITGDKGPALFTKNSGSFTCSQIQNMYCAVDQDVMVDIIVQVVIPEKRIYPDPKPGVYYTQYLDNGLPVYTLRTISDQEGLKKPTKYFECAAEVIRRYLNETSLSITLFDNKPIITKNLLIKVPPTTVFRGIGNNYGANLSSFNTDNQGSYKTDWYFFVNQGLELPPFNQTVRKISYNISLTSNIFPYSINAQVTMQWMSNGSIWHKHIKLNSAGQEDGEAIINYDGIPSPYIISGSMLLSNAYSDVNITVYYTSSNPSVIGNVASTAEFTDITVEYIPLQLII